jgi:hypothetical protein
MGFLKRLFKGRQHPADRSLTSAVPKPCTVELVGAYRMEPTRKQMGQAALFFGYDYLVTKTGLIRANEVSQYDLQDLALIELAVCGEVSVRDFVCRTNKSEQVAYLEFYLSADGEELLYHPTRDDSLSQLPSMKSAFEAVIKMEEPRRICFFLHFVSSGTTIRHKGTSLTVVELLDLPSRLEPFAHYIPVG